jgi:succinyl-CoA synthetase beta subunit
MLGAGIASNPFTSSARNAMLENVTINVSGGISTSAEIGQAVVDSIRAYNRSAGPARIEVSGYV